LIGKKIKKGGIIMVEIQSWTDTDWNTAITGGLDESELEGLLDAGATGASSIDISGFIHNATDNSWSFELEGVTYKISSDGALSYQAADGNFHTVSAGGTGVDVDDGLSADEAAAWNRLARTLGTSRATSGERAGFSFRPKSLFQKMIYGISDRINEMFLDLIAISTVLGNGQGLRGIMLLADKGIKIDGQDISQMLTEGDTSAALSIWGELVDGDLPIHNITDTEGNEITEETSTIRIHFSDQEGDFVDIDLGDDSALSLVVSYPPKDADGNFTEPLSVDCVDIKLNSFEAILESPGTLFLIQQLLSQMKDAVSAVQAIGKQPEAVRSQAVQDFSRSMGS
jgi:hypothetical protein